MSTRAFLIARRRLEGPTFRKVLEALPGDRWDYTPHERSPSARQVSTNIRPMGGKAPAIYGPSADDPGRG